MRTIGHEASHGLAVARWLRSSDLFLVILTWVVAGAIGALVGWWLVSPVDHGELGLEHDGNFFVEPLAAIKGWILAGVVGVGLARGAFRRDRVTATALATGATSLLVGALLWVPVGLGLYVGAIALVGPPALVVWAVAPPLLGRWVAVGRRNYGRRKAEGCAVEIAREPGLGDASEVGLPWCRARQEPAQRMADECRQTPSSGSPLTTTTWAPLTK